MVKCEHTYVGLVAFEKDRAFTILAYAENLAVIAGGHVELAAFINSEVPDVFGLRTKEYLCSGIVRRTFIAGGFLGSSFCGFRSRGALLLFFFFLVWRCRRELDFIHLAIRRRSGIEHAVVLGQRLYLQLLGFKDYLRFAVWGDAIDPGGRAGGSIYVAGAIGCDGPQIRGRRGVKRFELRRKLQCAYAAYSHAAGRTLFQFVKFGCLPGLRAFSKGTQS